MSLWSRIKSGFAASDSIIDAAPPGTTPDERDTLSVIRDLSRVVRNNPDAVETYLALGNLFRVKGDVERAVQIRESLLVRPELASSFKARAYFELGQDYRRAGIMDRALQAYSEASRFGVPQKQINEELAGLYADAGDWQQAAHYYSAIGNRIAEAHYMVRHGHEMLALSPEEPKRALRLFNKALKIYPASPEAWSALIIREAKDGKWPTAAKMLQKALDRIAPDKSFMLFEELLAQYADGNPKAASAPSVERKKIFREFNRLCLEHFLPVIGTRNPEIGPYYYAALILQRDGRNDEAEQWINKTLVIQPEFWFGRLTQLEIARNQYGMPPIVDTDLEFFIKQSGKLKRFVCAVCGLHRDVLFYCCPRCHSWHSAGYKFTLSE
ncbi:hypothetical protein LJC48_00405 [Desulfovibrio sp. OttesenSCG-928-C06]|nr:hypothetical protein [Desulfovibrio sp. OttesenSCG-928-C06]